MRGILNLYKDNFLFWLIYFTTYRAKHSLVALFCGMRLNRRGYGVIFNFRRNIHRIEKGLSNEPLKLVFAEDYILETVKDFARLQSIGFHDGATITWGHTVLEQFFGRCQPTEKNKKAYQIFKNLRFGESNETWCIYPEAQRPKLVVDYDAYYQLALRRRSIRRYLDKTVEFELIEKAMRVAVLSPSACNRQAYKFVFINDREIVEKIRKIPGGADYKLPALVVVLGNYRGYFDERDVNVPIIDASLAIMSFLFALETLGLSTVCINWPTLPDRHEAINQIIHLEEDEFIVLLVGVGYPDPEGKIAYSAKRELEYLLSHFKADG